MPRRVQIAARRCIARRVFASNKSTWPIDESAGNLPDGWSGWPDGRSFSLVLTHDVDTQYGLDHCRELMDIEEQLGFRSAFYFVPKGRYEIPESLLREMEARGFEVGVHGLYHDWWTFLSRSVFERRAPIIREYLKKWGAVGFRAPSMVKNLDWIGELGLEYDASTFDTDPFEPQPTGERTIFPFWMDGRAGRKGYVELPYTLAQDHTLFILLQSKDAEPWRKKLKWIASKGGMALLDTHPDYMSFDEHASRRGTYSVRHYRDMLAHIQSEYGGRYWLAQPRNMSRFWKRDPTRMRPRSRKRVCMVAYSFYDSDSRIIRYAESLAARGDHVDVLTLRGSGRTRREVVNGVTVNRIQPRRRDEKGPISYLLRILRFWVKSSTLLAWKHLQSPYDLIHVHSVPDFEVFAAWFPKLTGAKVILDIHDLVPEFYASKFGVKHEAPAFKLLLWMERASARFATHVIAANDIWFETLTHRSVPRSKCSAFVNYLDLRLFYRRPRTRTDDRIIIVYPGGLQSHQGVDTAIRAFALVKQRLPRAEFHIYGDGPERAKLKTLVDELGLEQSVSLHGTHPLREIPDIMANADVGIVPKRADSFGNEAYSTKILEYMSQGVPVVASRTKVDSHYFDDSVLRFFESGNPEALATAIVDVHLDRPLREKLVAGASAYVARNTWDARKGAYFKLVDDLCAK